MKDRRDKDKIVRSNTGFTLMEMLVTIVISAILIGMVTVTIAVVNNADAGKAARALNAAIGQARTESMAKGTDAGQLTLSMVEGALYYQIGDPTTAPMIQISSRLIGVEAVYDDTSLTTGSPLTTPVTVRFSTSGFQETGPSGNLSKIIFSRGTRRVETVLYLTGKHETNLL